MKSLSFRITSLLSIALLALIATNCRGGGTGALAPDLRASPSAVSFAACPSKDEMGRAVVEADGGALVFPDEQELTIENLGKVSSSLKLSITGAGASAFSFGTTPPTTIDAASSVKIPIRFAPTGKGVQTAQLVIDDEYDGTDNVLVTLSGEGLSLPSQPTLAVKIQKTDKSGFIECTPDSPLSDCTASFPDTLFGESNTMQIKISNTGCPALKVSRLVLEASGGASQGFSIETPAQLPGADTPMILSTADDTAETTLTIRFAPTDDGQNNYYRYATLSIFSNDPVTGDAMSSPAILTVEGNGSKPSMYAIPTFCDFSNANDTCGNTTKVTDKSKFRISNDGTESIVITSAKFLSNSSETASKDNRFTLAGALKNTTIQAGQDFTFEVNHADQPLYVSDQLEIVAGLTSNPSTTAGTVKLALYGGKKPCMTTDPADTLNFMNPQTEESAQTLYIKNGVGCGTLVVNEVTLDQSPFFTMITSPPANTQIAAGQQEEVTVTYKLPTTGGQKNTTLHIKSNDSDYGPPQYKLVIVQSDSPVDAPPIAVITACTPDKLAADPQCAAGASSLSAKGSTLNPKEITISGVNSTDEVPGMPGSTRPPTQYRFKFLTGPDTSVTSAVLANHDTKISTPTTKLTIDPLKLGTYRVQLIVYDDRGKESGPVTMAIQIN